MSCGQSMGDVFAHRAVDFTGNCTPPRHPREGGDPVQVSAFSPTSNAPQAAHLYADMRTESLAHLGSRLRGNDDKVIESAQGNGDAFGLRGNDDCGVTAPNKKNYEMNYEVLF
jgi:hypothetical protein